MKNNNYYAIADIHGNLSGLESALELIFKEFDEKTDKLVFLGDYIDRGKESFEVLLKIKELQGKYGDDVVIAVLGNHDTMFFEWVEFPFAYNSLKNDWNLNTVKSFLPNSEDKEALYLSSDGLIYNKYTMEEQSTRIAAYIKNLELYSWYKELPYFYDRIEEDNVLFIHAGIEEEVLGEDWRTWTTKDTMVWKYPPSYGPNPYGFNLVLGHTIVDEFWKFSEGRKYDIFKTGNHYYIDSGSPLNKNLNVLKIEDGRYFDFVSKMEIEDN